MKFRETHFRFLKDSQEVRLFALPGEWYYGSEPVVRIVDELLEKRQTSSTLEFDADPFVLFDGQGLINSLSPLAIGLICKVFNKHGYASDSDFSQKILRHSQRSKKPVNWPEDPNKPTWDTAIWSNILESALVWDFTTKEELDPPEVLFSSSWVFAYSRLIRLCRNAFDHFAGNLVPWELANFTRKIVDHFSDILHQELADDSKLVAAQDMVAKYPVPYSEDFLHPFSAGFLKFEPNILILVGIKPLLLEDPSYSLLHSVLKLPWAHLLCLDSDLPFVTKSWEGIVGEKSIPQPLPVSDLGGVLAVLIHQRRTPKLFVHVFSEINVNSIGDVVKAGVGVGAVETWFLTHLPSEVRRTLKMLKVGLYHPEQHNVVERSWSDFCRDTATVKLSLDEALGPPIAIPRPKSQKPYLLTRKDQELVMQYFEIVHRDVGQKHEDEFGGLRSEFLRGGSVISWYLLRCMNQNKGLIWRDDFEKMQGVIEQAAQFSTEGIAGRHFQQVSCFHEPGTGATTILHFVLFALRMKFPCVLLRIVPEEADLRRVLTLLSKGGLDEVWGLQPVVIACDNVSLKEIQQLSSFLMRINVPVVLVSLRRLPKHSSESHSSKLTIQLSSSLSQAEVRDLDSLFTLVTGRKTTISECIKEYEDQPSSTGIEIPSHLVYFGMCYFRWHYNVDRHVASWLEPLSEAAKSKQHAQLPDSHKLLLLSSLVSAYTEGTRSLSFQDVLELFKLPFSYFEDDWKQNYPILFALLRTDSGMVRPIHAVLGKAVIHWYISIMHKEKESNLLQNVVADSIFAPICRETRASHSVRTTLEKLLFERKGEDAKRDPFSLLIEDMSSGVAGSKNVIQVFSSAAELPINGSFPFKASISLARWHISEKAFLEAHKVLLEVTSHARELSENGILFCTMGDLFRAIGRQSGRDVSLDEPAFYFTQTGDGRDYIAESAFCYLESLRTLSDNHVALLGLCKLVDHVASTKTLLVKRIVDNASGTPIYLLDSLITALEFGFHVIASWTENITAVFTAVLSSITNNLQPFFGKLPATGQTQDSPETALLHRWLVYHMRGPFPLGSGSVHNSAEAFCNSFTPNLVANCGERLPRLLARILWRCPHIFIEIQGSPPVTPFLGEKESLLFALWQMAHCWIRLWNNRESSVWNEYHTLRKDCQRKWEDHKLTNPEVFDQQRLYTKDSRLTYSLAGSTKFSASWSESTGFTVAEIGNFSIPLARDENWTPKPSQSVSGYIGLNCVGPGFIPL